MRDQGRDAHGKREERTEGATGIAVSFCQLLIPAQGCRRFGQTFLFLTATASALGRCQMASGFVRVVLAQPEHWTIGILSSNSGLSKSNNELRGVNRFRTQNFTSQSTEHGGWYQFPPSHDAWTGSPPASNSRFRSAPDGWKRIPLQSKTMGGYGFLPSAAAAVGHRDCSPPQRAPGQ